MVETANPMLLHLMTWLSPAFPVGGFAYSQGLEAASQKGDLSDKEDLRQWLKLSLHNGPLRNDAILIAATWRKEQSDEALNALALALANSRERYDELIAMGQSFQKAAAPWAIDPQKRDKSVEQPDLAYPIAIATTARSHAIPLIALIQAFLHSALVNQIQASQRLAPIGQEAAMELLHDLQQDCLHQAEQLAQTTLDDLGSSAFMMDCAALNHATLQSRIFRS